MNVSMREEKHVCSLNDTFCIKDSMSFATTDLSIYLLANSNGYQLFVIVVKRSSINDAEFPAI